MTPGSSQSDSDSFRFPVRIPTPYGDDEALTIADPEAGPQTRGGGVHFRLQVSSPSFLKISELHFLGNLTGADFGKIRQKSPTFFEKFFSKAFPEAFDPVFTRIGPQLPP